MGDKMNHRNSVAMQHEKHEMKFSQSAAVTRCRNMKEGKLKAQQAIAKFADEEATIYTAQIEDERYQLNTQLTQQISIEARQSSEAVNVKISWERKQQLTSLLDKLAAVRKKIMFQQETQERESSLKNKIRERKAAFQNRLAKLEQRQASERTELLLAQRRLSETVNQIRAIELKSIKDKNQARRVKRENEIHSQQVSMRQQKESEFLREIQLCKARQMGEINDIEIFNMEELEELTSQQRQEEFDLLAKQAEAEAEMTLSTERQKFKFEADILSDKQRDLRACLTRTQKKNFAQVAKSQRAARRAREKTLLNENPVIDSGRSQNDEEETMSKSESESNADSSNGGGSVVGGSVEEINVDAESGDKPKGKTELEKNSAMNKNTQVLNENEKQIQILIESGQERLKNLIVHHKKVLSELKQQQRSATSQKTKEHRRKFSELLKEHEEEIEQIKAEQAATMEELLQTHLASEELRADTAQSQNLLGMMLPGHIMEQIEVGVVPAPEQFNCVTVFFTDIYDFKKLVGEISPVLILRLLNELYTKFDEIIAKYTQLYKVESVSDTYMVASGISSSYEKSDAEIVDCTLQALSCAQELQLLVRNMNLMQIIGRKSIDLRIGIHAGAINAGLIGTKMSRYCLFGDTVNTASRMCTTGQPGKVQVSMQVIQLLGDDDNFEFEERGEIEVKGKGRMTTYWLSV